MKKKLLIFLMLSATHFGIYAQNIVPNGNFESWTDLNYDNPLNYISTNIWSVPEIGVASCVKTTDSYTGQFAAKLSVVTNDMSYLSNYSPDGPPPWHGGFPYSETPTGLTGYYKCNIPAGDSALIVINFSKNGVGTDLYFYKITGTVTNYTQFNIPFTPALSQQPDSVIIFITAGDPFYSPIIGSTITLDNISFTGVSSQPAMLNGDFELWENNNISLVDNWQQDTHGENFVQKTTDRKEGSFAVELTTYLDNNEGQPRARASRISFNVWDNDCQCDIIKGIPFSNQIDTLCFWYKYTPSANDISNVYISFYNSGNNIHGDYRQLQQTTTYQYMEIPFDLFQAPDTVNIEFSSSIWEDSLAIYAGSVLKVDDVKFKSQPLSINQFNHNNDDISAYPNPSNGKFTFNINSNSRLEIFNINGSKVWTQTIDLKNNTLDITNQPNGIYLYKITGNDFVKTGKLYVE